MNSNRDALQYVTEPVDPICREPRVYARSEHPISRKHISELALRVLYRLHNAGHRACLVGGSVRDLLLGVEPKDFDVATDASPERVRELFRNCRLIGRRFRLAHVHFGREIIEVATFRAAHDEEHEDALVSAEGRILRDNVYGDIHDDVWRRDFSINALYYDIADFSLVDYVGGFEDIKARRLRLIGDPDQRYREDPVRMLRAVRFAAKLGLTIEEGSAEPLARLGHLLDEIAPARMFDEMLKLFHSGVATGAYELLRAHGLFARLLPQTDQILDRTDGDLARRFIVCALANTDRRIAEDKPVAPAFLLAALLWPPVEVRCRALLADGLAPAAAPHVAADEVIAAQARRIAIPRRFTNVTREIWALQPRLQRPARKRVAKLAEHPRFRAAYDFLMVRAEAGDDVGEAAEWWTRYQASEGDDRAAVVEALQPAASTTRRRRRRTPRAAAGSS